MKKFILMVGVLFLLFGCGIEQPSLEKDIPKDIKYTVLSEDTKRDIKRVLRVELNKRVDEEILKKIGVILKRRETQSYKRTFIGYFLKGEGRNGYWATTNFNPTLEVKILGASASKMKNLIINPKVNPERKIVGTWLDKRDMRECRITLFYTKDKLFLEKVYTDGSSGIDEMFKKNSRVDYKKDNNDIYFIIDKNNNLEHWSKEGKGYIAKSI